MAIWNQLKVLIIEYMFVFKWSLPSPSHSSFLPCSQLHCSPALQSHSYSTFVASGIYPQFYHISKTLQKHFVHRGNKDSRGGGKPWAEAASRLVDFKQLSEHAGGRIGLLECVISLLRESRACIALRLPAGIPW